MLDASVPITPGLVIPMDELRFRFAPSSGPGGQNVNRVSTRAELIFDVTGSLALSDWQRDRILTRLAGYINKQNLLSLSSQRTRSQWRNRLDVLSRFQSLLRQALHRPKPRRPTRPTRGSRERRLSAKRRRAQTKQHRRGPAADGDQ